VTTAQIIQEFRDSVTPILLAQDDFIKWGAVNAALSKHEKAALSLQRLRDSGEVNEKSLAKVLAENPDAYEVALSLIAFMRTGSQTSKWGLPDRVPGSAAGREHLASQLLHIGLDRAWSGSAPISDLLRVAEVFKDSFRRRFRSGERVETSASKIVREAIHDANQELREPARIGANGLPDSQLRRSLDYVIFIGDRPVLGISTVFQNQSGGRQQRDLSVTYPALQTKMLEYGIDLVLIADGQGIREASDRTLQSLFANVCYPMTLSQAGDGALMTALLDVAHRPPPESLDAGAVSRLITEALNVRDNIKASELPLSQSPAVIALANYFENHRNLNLKLRPDGDELSWAEPEAVSEARAVTARFDAERAIRAFANKIGSSETEVCAEELFHRSLVETPDSPPFTGKALVAANSSGLTSDLIRDLGRQALELAPGSPFAFLLAKEDLSESEIKSLRKRQALLPVNIVVIGAGLLRRISRSRDPITVLTDAILNQSDLTKVSPFILSNATPERMFYGREAEAATILGTLGTNSVALLGSRRIGKSSLLRRVRFELQEANFLPFFGDCQTVRTWQDFAALASTEWGVESPADFRPPHLAGLIKSLSQGSEKPVVILLDEIDQLLDWDQSHTEDSVPEAFFRTCRSLSQDGVAQFVFSGERTIAQRNWDPHSPHWNFCRPLELTQLTEEAATALLFEPLRAMNIRIEDEAAFKSEAWRLTSGHPQIVQYMGDRLIRRLDAESDRKSLQLSADDIRTVAQSYEFAEHYLNTYWGQATSFERDVTLKILSKPLAINDLFEKVRSDQPGLEEIYLQAAIRMLQLYGIVNENDGKIGLRARWFQDALSFFGSASEIQADGRGQ